MKRGFATILVLGLIAAIFVLSTALYLKLPALRHPGVATTTIGSQNPSPTPQSSPIDETANWKTYTNNQYSFSLKYPTEWSFENVKTPSAFPPGSDAINQTTINFGEISAVDPAGQNITPYIPSAYLTLSIVTYSTDPTLSLNKYIESLGSPKDVDVMINNTAAKKIEHQMCQSGKCLEVLVVRDNSIITFFTQNPSTFSKEFDQILSTFKFSK